MQCCGSETIYSGSGSSFEFSQFRIRIQPILIKYLYFEKIQKHPLNSIKKRNISNNVFAILYSILPVLSNSTVLFKYSFTFCWIRNYNSGSGSTTLLLTVHSLGLWQSALHRQQKNKQITVSAFCITTVIPAEEQGPSV